MEWDSEKFLLLPTLLNLSCNNVVFCASFDYRGLVQKALENDYEDDAVKIVGVENFKISCLRNIDLFRYAFE